MKLTDHEKEDRTAKQRERRALSIADATEQACEYFGFLAAEELDLGDDGPYLRIPNPQLLSPEQQAAFNKLRMEFEDCDREDDINLPDGNVIRGAFLDPRRRDGVLVEPGYDVQLAIALWGEDDYRRFEAAGGRPGLISIVWARMDDEFRRRERNDSKSTRSA